MNASGKDNFGLDPKNADDAKKLKQCSDLLDKAIAQKIKDNDADGKALDDLDKHLNHVRDYSPST